MTIKNPSISEATIGLGDWYLRFLKQKRSKRQMKKDKKNMRNLIILRVFISETTTLSSICENAGLVINNLIDAQRFR